jgi:hypothetical protein
MTKGEMLDGCLTEHHWMLAMAIYELLATALNFDTIMHSSVTLCGSLFSTWKERTKSAFAVTTRKLSINKFQNISWSDCSKKHKTIKSPMPVELVSNKNKLPSCKWHWGSICNSTHCSEYIE